MRFVYTLDSIRFNEIHNYNSKWDHKAPQSRRFFIAVYQEVVLQEATVRILSPLYVTRF